MGIVDHYVSNRGDDTIVVFDIDQRTGELEVRQRAVSQGSVPWCMTVDGTGQWMVVGNLASNRLEVLRIDAETGELEPKGQSLEVPQPSSLAICAAK